MTSLWDMATTTAQEARVLLENDFARGASSRAYYAMFDAARAALWSIDPQLVETKTHRTILRRFAQHCVRSGGLDPKLSRMILHAFELRNSADYDMDAITMETARSVFKDMETFMAEIRSFLTARGGP